MTATLIAVQQVEQNGQILAPGTVFSTDDVSAAALLGSNLAATSVSQQTADAATFPVVPSDAATD